MRISRDASSEQFLADLARLDDKLARVQRSLTSGFRVIKPSDDPDQVTDILQLQAQIARTDGIQTNLTRVRAETDTAEAALHVGIQLLERARTIAAQTATATATNRVGIAIEVRQLHEQLVSLTKTVSEGRFVFSGDRDDIALYAADWNQPGGITQTVPPVTNTRQIEDVNGTKFSVYRTASQIFDDRDGGGAFSVSNAFHALWELGKALEADDGAAVTAAAGHISAALDHLGRELTFFGIAQNRIQDASNLAAQTLVARSKELSERRDTDLPTAIVDLSTAKVHREAALGAQSQRPRSSLFDYLG